MLHVQAEGMYSVIYVGTNWLMMLLRASLSSLIFCMAVLPVIESDIVKSPTIIIELFLSSVPFMSASYDLGPCY